MSVSSSYQSVLAHAARVPVLRRAIWATPQGLGVVRPLQVCIYTASSGRANMVYVPGHSFRIPKALSALGTVFPANYPSSRVSIQFWRRGSI